MVRKTEEHIQHCPVKNADCLAATVCHKETCPILNNGGAK